ncbi:hypothetical protein AVEN_97692-1 [Araneus ventricosus]|uniref:Uncharacterized protein n=1 Tax=Araneus ventricosus TaxID=182803 RepID=A0A4Y2PS36_ARAVE|nr:hypothetical protein AVEN_97692-1 [Araneus ventricosus]
MSGIIFDYRFYLEFLCACPNQKEKPRLPWHPGRTDQPGRRDSKTVSMAIYLKPAIHFTDKLDILEREKEKAIEIYGNQPNGFGGWNSVWTEIGTKNRRDPKEASGKSNAVRRLKPRFEVA